MAFAQRFGTARETFFTGHVENLIKHVCPPAFGGGPLDAQPAVRFLERGLLVGFDMPLPPIIAARLGRTALPMWIIENGLAADTPADPKRAYPSPLIRTVQGDVVHTEAKGKGGSHTIHWHGIEPVPTSDGVGKHSFEINGNFVYQFQTNEAGTYFYHCHKNTTLHFHMGLWGGLIVDPRPPAGSALTAPYATGGPGHAVGYIPGNINGVFRYAVEKIWAVDSLDSFWHLFNPNHNHNMQKCDNADPNNPANFYQFGSGAFELNSFNPDVFTVSGVVMDSPATLPPFTGIITDPAVAITAKVGDTVLLRYINASYTIQDLRLPVDATVIAWDGHPLGRPGFHAFSAPYKVPAGTAIRTTSARRMDIILNTSASYTGPLPATIRSYDWIKRDPESREPNFLLAEISIPVVINVAVNNDRITVTRARFSPRNRRLEVQATSSLGLPMTAQVFAGTDSLGPFPLDRRGRLTVTLPGTATPTTVVVSSAQGTSGPVTVVVR